ncbi:MAG: hypothetical protein AAF567_24700 [Actinomycetota bacterium]
MPPWLRSLAWKAAFAALLARAIKGIRSLDELPPEPQPAQWPPLAFERPAADTG